MTEQGMGGLGRTKGGTILVVDDEEAIRGMVNVALRYEGYTVVTAGSGLQAPNAADTHDPRLVLLDVKLPNFDGFAATTCAWASLRGSRRHLQAIRHSRTNRSR